MGAEQKRRLFGVGALCAKTEAVAVGTTRKEIASREGPMILFVDKRANGEGVAWDFKVRGKGETVKSWGKVNNGTAVTEMEGAGIP